MAVDSRSDEVCGVQGAELKSARKARREARDQLDADTLRWIRNQWDFSPKREPEEILALLEQEEYRVSRSHTLRSRLGLF